MAICILVGLAINFVPRADAKNHVAGQRCDRWIGNQQDLEAVIKPVFVHSLDLVNRLRRLVGNGPSRDQSEAKQGNQWDRDS